MVRNTVRLDRLLANLGYCSRRSSLAYIRRHKITYEGEVVLSASKHVPQDGAGVAINDEPLLPSDTKPLHILLHKPSGYVCTREQGEHKTVYDLLPPDFYKRRPLLNICGRLDRWVTGLVFLTQDGQLQHQVASPNRKAKKRLGKTYIIKAWRGFNGNEPEIFKAGTLMLNGETKPCKPADLEILDPVNNMAKVTLYEGKYHQIRRMFSAIGNGVPREITRVAIGPMELGSLGARKWRHLTDEELRALRALVDAGETPKHSATKEKEKKEKEMTKDDDADEANTEHVEDGEEEDETEDEDYEDYEDDDDDDDEDEEELTNGENESKNEDEDDLMKMWAAERSSLAKKKKSPGPAVARGKESADVR